MRIRDFFGARGEHHTLVGKIGQNRAKTLVYQGELGGTSGQNRAKSGKKIDPWRDPFRLLETLEETPGVEFSKDS